MNVLTYRVCQTAIVLALLATSCCCPTNHSSETRSDYLLKLEQTIGRAAYFELKWKFHASNEYFDQSLAELENRVGELEKEYVSLYRSQATPGDEGIENIDMRYERLRSIFKTLTMEMPGDERIHDAKKSAGILELDIIPRLVEIRYYHDWIDGASHR